MKAKILSVNTSQNKGERKKPSPSATLAPGGIIGDGHFGSGTSKREISILDWSSVKKLISDASNRNINSIKISFGDFAENITTENLDIKNISIGDTLAIYNNHTEGKTTNSKQADDKKEVNEPVLLKVTAIGKECHNDCVIKSTIGDCVMPREGIFASVIRGGVIKPGDIIKKVSGAK